MNQAKVKLPSLRDMTPVAARAKHRATVMRNRGGAREPVASVRDISIPYPGGELAARTYRASMASPAAVAIVYMHGGGWVLGDLDTQDAICRRLANVTGSVVVAVAYRLAPEHPYPAAVDDCLNALLWTVKNAEALGASPHRIAVAGSSAGANVAAGTALRCRDEGAAALVAQLLVYPPTDPLLMSPSVTENAEGYYLTASDMRRFIDAYLPDPQTRTEAYAAPLHARSLAGLPSAVVTTAGFDPLRDEGCAYVERLRMDGVAVRHLHYPDLVHGYFGLAGNVAAAARARDEVLLAFKEVLLPASI